VSLGSFLPGFFSNYVFYDERMIGESLVLTIVLASIVGASLFRFTYASYRRDHQLQNG